MIFVLRGVVLGLVVAVGIGVLPSIVECMSGLSVAASAADRQRILANAIAEAFHTTVSVGVVAVPAGIALAWWSARRRKA